MKEKQSKPSVLHQKGVLLSKHPQYARLQHDGAGSRGGGRSPAASRGDSGTQKKKQKAPGTDASVLGGCPFSQRDVRALPWVWGRGRRRGAGATHLLLVPRDQKPGGYTQFLTKLSKPSSLFHQAQKWSCSGNNLDMGRTLAVVGKAHTHARVAVPAGRSSSVRLTGFTLLPSPLSHSTGSVAGLVREIKNRKSTKLAALSPANVPLRAGRLLSILVEALGQSVLAPCPPVSRAAECQR